MKQVNIYLFSLYKLYLMFKLICSLLLKSLDTSKIAFTTFLHLRSQATRYYSYVSHPKHCNLNLTWNIHHLIRQCSCNGQSPPLTYIYHSYIISFIGIPRVTARHSSARVQIALYLLVERWLPCRIDILNRLSLIILIKPC